jgi:enterochelin esterase family protein
MANAATTAGRLAPIAELVEAARAGGDVLAQRLPGPFPELAAEPGPVAAMRAFHGHASPPDLGSSITAVWDDACLFVVNAGRRPVLELDGAGAQPLDAVPGTPYWFRVEPVERGRVHLFRFGIDGSWGPLGDLAGYAEQSYEQPGVARGTLSEARTVESHVYPGATTQYWVYANHGIDEQRGAPVLFWHDGAGCLAPSDLVGLRLQIVSDNLVHLGLIPPLAHVLVQPSTGGEGAAWNVQRYASTMRGIQYDTFSDRFGKHVVDEVLPHAGQLVKLRSDAYSRGVAGASSGGLSALTLAWFAPEQFSRVHSVIGSFVDIHGGHVVPHLVRREPRRNIRVWLSDGANDLELDGVTGGAGAQEVFAAGSWPLQNILLANALKGRGYDFHFRFGEGVHGFGQPALDLPESLAWLWRGYDPERTEQEYEQDPAERERPVYRVRVANRDAW